LVSAGFASVDPATDARSTGDTVATPFVVVVGVVVEAVVGSFLMNDGRGCVRAPGGFGTDFGSAIAVLPRRLFAETGMATGVRLVPAAVGEQVGELLDAEVVLRLDWVMSECCGAGVADVIFICTSSFGPMIDNTLNTLHHRMTVDWITRRPVRNSEDEPMKNSNGTTMIEQKKML
jgi:hypothetical protein